MQTLHPFENSGSADHVTAEITVSASLITLEYRPQFASAVLGLPAHNFDRSAVGIPREDGLWQSTCFEAFLQPAGEAGYYEFNFSLKPAWNCYEFKKYREPQPPRTSEAFALSSFQWHAQAGLLTIRLENKTEFSAFRASLTAVIETADHRKHYWATYHSESKADFHALNSFVLQRNSKA